MSDLNLIFNKFKFFMDKSFNLTKIYNFKSFFRISLIGFILYGYIY